MSQEVGRKQFVERPRSSVSLHAEKSLIGLGRGDLLEGDEDRNQPVVRGVKPAIVCTKKEKALQGVRKLVLNLFLFWCDVSIRPPLSFWEASVGFLHLRRCPSLCFVPHLLPHFRVIHNSWKSTKSLPVVLESESLHIFLQTHPWTIRT